LSLGSLIFESIAGPCSTENFLGTNSLAYFIPRSDEEKMTSLLG
jgi:hypothetical protein